MLGRAWLILFLLTSPALAGVNENPSLITVFNFKSPYGIDWSSPSNLAVSAIKNTLAYKVGASANIRNVGHSAVKLACKTPQGQPLYFSVSQQDPEGEIQDLLWENSGLGVLLHRFKGQIQDQEKLKKEIQKGRKKGNVNSLTYLIENKTCLKLEAHYKEWIKRKAYLNYGLNEDPLAYTGGGSCALAVSFLRVANIAPSAHLKSWQKTIFIPDELIGVHNRLPYVNQKQKVHQNKSAGAGVNVLRLLLGSNNWGSPHDETSSRLDIWSPDMMFDWTKSAAKQNRRGLAQDSLKAHKVEKIFKSVNLVFDARAN